MSAAVAPAVHPLLARLSEVHGFACLTEDAELDAFARRAGRTILFFAEEPARLKETLDLAVILPEVVRANEPVHNVAVLMPALANRRAATYGVRRWPTLAFLRDGGFLGTIEGLREWAAYVELSRELLAGPARELPPKVIPVAAAGPACGQERP